MTTTIRTPPADLIQQADLADLMAPRPGPCLSIYLPTTTSFRDADQHRIAFRNLLDRADAELAQVYHRSPRRRDFLAPLRLLEEDTGFWRKQMLGLAAFVTNEEVHLFRLLRTPPSLAVVASSFHVKPLIRIVQDSQRFEVLGLTPRHMKLWEGNQYDLIEVELSYRPPEIAPPPEITSSPATRCPEGVLWQGEEVERIFRQVDEVVWERSRITQLPLLLMALPENQAIFRKISRNPHLLPQGLEHDPYPWPNPVDLRNEAWDALQPELEKRRQAVIDRYEQAYRHGRASDDLDQLAHDAVFGRIQTLLVDGQRQIAGRIEPNGQLLRYRIEDAYTDDVLDDLAELTLHHGGQVLVLPSDRIPCASGACGISRW